MYKDMEVGEVREHDGHQYTCVESRGCKGCAFTAAALFCIRPAGVFGFCSTDTRADKKPVMFVREKI